MQMHFIYYDPDPKYGRFGNMLFKYFACHIIKQVYGHTLTRNVNDIVCRKTVSDDDWIQWSSSHQKDGYDWGNFDLVLHGAFQQDLILNQHRDFFKSLIHEGNHDAINDIVSVRDIALPLQNVASMPQTNDLVVHIRLDDFNHNGYNSEIVHVRHFIELIESLEFNRLFIVVDQIRNAYEETYMSHFRKYDPILIQQTVIEDFKFLIYAQNIICSNSTFAWMAAFLGNASNIWVFNNNFHGRNQVLRTIGLRSTYVEVTNMDIKTGREYHR